MQRRLSIQRAWLAPSCVSQDDDEVDDDDDLVILERADIEEAVGATRPAEGFIPMFLACCALPGGVPCPLHVFEPRYRLMINHVLEIAEESDTEPEFGMTAVPAEPGTMAEYGTIVRIRRSTQFPDGRFALDTVGVRRFRVLETGTAGESVSQISLR